MSAPGFTSPGFVGGTLDRADALRHDPARLAAAAVDPAARLMLLRDYEPQVGEDGRLGWTAMDGAAVDALVLVGLDDGAPRFARITGEPAPRGRSPALNTAIETLRPEEASTYAAARSVLDWHGRNRFCANCGHESHAFRAGWGRRCPNCGTDHFPRVDPVVIMIAEHDGRALVARQPSWPEGRYSALAGFLEPGESIEEAVAREVWEETGVRVADVRYLASQPWPFPSSLMIACVARAEADAITLDEYELEHAMWLTRAEVRAALAGEEGARFRVPPPYAIAHTLLTRWAAEG